MLVLVVSMHNFIKFCLSNLLPCVLNQSRGSFIFISVGGNL